MNTPSPDTEAIVDAALDLPSTERSAYLDRVCGDDAALRQTAEALLRAHQHAPTPRAQAPPPTAVSEKPGDKIGSYKLLQRIGEGGCGVVYMAEQEEPVRRRVALKVIKLGMDTKQVIARFEAERQALALMDHPNIAKVLEAGASETGRPYFVMELVRGIKITDFCNQNNMLTQKRLELFIQVCKAVQHAHQKGVIHRDLKPSNILVTLHDGVPVPKIIDFGIAKATAQRLTDKTLFTAFEQFIGTPAYMSPEQAEMSGLDIDTRSDIYSLGVLLYELLTSRIPFDPKELAAVGLDAMRRIIREKDPVRPSTKLSTLTAAEQTTVARQRQVEVPKLVHLVRGDLDWIVMKCLEKDRTRRYETADGLAHDVERHLSSEPVVARPPSRLYLLAKLVRRNKTVFAAMVAVTATLIFGLGLSTFLFIRELRARRLARAEAQKNEVVTRFLTDMLEGVGPAVALGQDTKLLRGILDKTAQRIDKDLEQQPEVQAELLVTIGEVYSALAEFQTAEAMQRRALSIRTNLWGERHLKVAEAWDRLTGALWGQGKLDEAIAAERNALTVRTQLLPHVSADVASSLNNLGVLLGDQGDLDQARSLLDEALTIQTNLFKGDDERVATTLYALATVLWKQRDLTDAERLNREALAMYRRMPEPDAPSEARILNNLGTVLRDKGDLKAAEQVTKESLEIGRKILGNAHPETGNSIYNLAGVFWQEHELGDAEALYREWLDLPDRNPQQLAVTLNNLGTVLRDQGRFQEAITTHRRALSMQVGIAGQEFNIATSLHNLAGALWNNGELKEAEAHYRTLITNWTALYGAENQYVAIEYNNLGTVLRDADQLDDAKKAHERGLEMQRKLKDRLGEARSLNNLANVLLKQDQPAEAKQLLQESVALFREHAGDDNRFLATPLRTLAVLFQNAHSLNEAEDAARDCLAICEKNFTNEWQLFDAQSVLGGILAAKPGDTNAEPLLLSGFNGLEQRADHIPASTRLRVGQACERLIQFYESRHQLEAANLWKTKLAELDASQREARPARR